MPKSLSITALYGHTNKLELPFTNLIEEFKASRAREVHHSFLRGHYYEYWMEVAGSGSRRVSSGPATGPTKQGWGLLEDHTLTKPREKK